MTQIIPLKPVPAQALQVQLGQQAVALTIKQTIFGLFVDVYVAGVPVVLGVIAENLNKLIRSPYFEFVGDLAFTDTQGTSDPVYTGLGSRYLLVYAEEQDLAGG